MIKIGTRSSPLALWQAEYVATLLQEKCNQQTQIAPYITEGDRKLETSLAWKGGKGLFIKDIQKAIYNGEADIAVHSMKDVPIDELEDFALPAILNRDSPYDVLISKHYNSLDDLPKNAVIGTSSFRRGGQIKYCYPEFSIKLLRGNINTRINKCLQGEYDAIILAQAGVDRMQMHEHVKQVLPTEICLPAIGQGAIGIECLRGNEEIIEILSQLDDASTRLCVEAEREFNQYLGGNCHSPVACYAELKGEAGESIFMRAVVTDPEGTQKITHEISGDALAYPDLAKQLAQKMLANGAVQMMEINAQNDE